MSDQPARCLKCYYILDGLDSSRCPECGREFDLNDPRTYTRKPRFIRWKFWFPGLVLSFGVGLLLYAATIYLAGYGWATSLVVPFSVGTLLGYSCRVRIFVLVLLAIIVAVALAFGLFSLSLVGVFCGMCLAGIMLGPLLVGSLCGAMLRLYLKQSKFDQRWYFPFLTLLLAFSTITWAIVERLIHVPFPNERIVTTVDIPAPLDRTWNAVMFYEEVKHRPPFLMRFALPHPLYTTGSIESVGDIKLCVYNKGRLAKQVTERDPDHLLAFHVILQQNIENRSVILTGGSFQFEPIDAKTTRVSLTTEYQPLLSPRCIWGPFERLGVHTLHDYVLDGMKRKAQTDATAYASSDGDR